MRLRGTIRDSKETIVGANVYVSDRNGKLLSPTVGTASNYQGKFKLDGLKPTDYVSIKFIGYKTITKKVSDLGSGITISREFLMQPSSSELEEFTVIEYKDNPPTSEPIGDTARKDKRNYKPFIIGGIALVVIIGGFITYKMVKK